jgi:hypothetical protein
VVGEEYHAFLFLVIFSSILRCNTKDKPDLTSGGK